MQFRIIMMKFIIFAYRLVFIFILFPFIKTSKELFILIQGNILSMSGHWMTWHLINYILKLFGIVEIVGTCVFIEKCTWN